MLNLMAAVLLVCPGDVVLAGLGNGTDQAVAAGTDLVIGFTTGQGGFALSSVRLFGPSLQGTASITFRLKDAQGNSLAFGGSWLNVNLDPAGAEYDFTPSAIGSYELQNGASYQLSMFTSSAALLMAQANGNVYAPTGWVQDSNTGSIKYSLQASAVPEPGNFFLGAIAALGGLLFWWLR